MRVVERWEGGSVRIVGAGAIGCALAHALVREGPGRAVEIYTRSDPAHRDGWPAGVRVRALATLGEGPRGPRGEIPVVLCLSAQERVLIAAELARGAAEVPRAVVARASIEALDRDLPWAALEHAPVLTVTNPVELVCELVARRTGNPAVVGFGLASDRERIVEALARGFGVADPGPHLALTGVHGSRAIPALAGMPGLCATLARTAPEAVHRGLAATRGPHETAPGLAAQSFARLLAAARLEDSGEVETAHALLDLAVRAITAAEFDGPRPPVSRPVSVLARQLAAWLAGRVADAAEVSGAVEHEGARVFLGGRLTAAGFEAPELAGFERELLSRELERHRAQVLELIGEVG